MSGAFSEHRPSQRENGGRDLSLLENRERSVWKKFEDETLKRRDKISKKLSHIVVGPSQYPSPPHLHKQNRPLAYTTGPIFLAKFR
jgi:hypothetical protein